VYVLHDACVERSQDADELRQMGLSQKQLSFLYDVIDMRIQQALAGSAPPAQPHQVKASMPRNVHSPMPRENKATMLRKQLVSNLKRPASTAATAALHKRLKK
jgi:hypothetical protein